MLSGSLGDAKQRPESIASTVAVSRSTETAGGITPLDQRGALDGATPTAPLGGTTSTVGGDPTNARLTYGTTTGGTPSPPARAESERSNTQGSCSNAFEGENRLSNDECESPKQEAPSSTTKATMAAAPSTTTTTRRPKRRAANKSITERQDSDPEVEIVGSTGTASSSSPATENKSSSNTAASASGTGSSAASHTARPSGGQKRELRQTVISFGISNEPALRKEIGEKDSAINELNEQILHLKEELAAAKHDTEQAYQEAAAVAEEDDRMHRYQSVLREAMIQQAQTQRRDARRKQHNLHFELGQISVVGTSEMWIQGNRYREILAELQAIEQRLEIVTQSKKEAQQSKRMTSSKLSKAAKDRSGASPTQGPGAVFTVATEDGENSSGFAQPLAPGSGVGTHISEYLFAEEMAEIHKLEAGLLVTQKNSLMQEKNEMEARRIAFLKECRRIEDEDHSYFSSRVDIGPKETPNRYVLLYLLGKGGFSEVWKAFDLHQGLYVGLKIHHIDRSWGQVQRSNYLKHLNREIEIMRKLDHPRLIKFYGCFEIDANSAVSVMEYCGGTDLDTHLKNSHTLKESDAKLIMKQVVTGIRVLHEQKVIHYDLKPANILFASELSSCMEVKITDFGLSKIVEDTQQQGNEIELTSQGTGTFWYLPPECFGSRKRVSNKVDVWAIGVMFYQLLVGRKPFANDESQREIWQRDSITKAAKGGISFPAELKISQGCEKFIRDCLIVDPNERPDVAALSSHPYFVGERKRPRVLMEAVTANVPANNTFVPVSSVGPDPACEPPAAPPLRQPRAST